MRLIARFVLPLLLSFVVSATNASETDNAGATLPADKHTDPGQTATPLLGTGIAVEVLRRFPEAVLSCEHGGQYGEPMVDNNKTIQFDSAPTTGSKGCSLFLVRPSLGFFRSRHDWIASRIEKNWSYLSDAKLVDTISIVEYVVKLGDSVPCQDQAARDNQSACNPLTIATTDEDEAMGVLDTSNIRADLYRNKINAIGIELVDVDRITSFPATVQARLREVLKKPGDHATVVTINWFFAEKHSDEKMLTRN